MEAIVWGPDHGQPNKEPAKDPFPWKLEQGQYTTANRIRVRADIQDKENTVKETNRLEKNKIKNNYRKTLQIPITYKIFLPKTSDYLVPQLSKSCCLFPFVRYL